MSRTAITRRFLPNGIEWISDVRPDATQFYAAVVSKMGSELDGSKHHNMHLLEHMMFHGHSPSESRRMYLDQRRKGIKSQGATSPQVMYAYFAGPARHQKSILDYAALAATNSEFSKTEFRVEKNVLLREVPQLWSEDLWMRAQMLLDASVHPHSPYGITHPQELQGLSSLRLGDVQKLHRAAFSPPNMAVITISSKNGSDLERAILERFLPITGTPPTLPVYTPQPLTNSFIVAEQAGITTCFVRHTMVAGKPSFKKDVAFWVVDEILRGHDSSLLFAEMRLRDGRVYSPRTHMQVMRPQSEMYLFYSCLPKDVEFNVVRVKNVLSSLAEKPLSSSMVEDFKRFAVMEFKSYIRNEENRIDFFSENISESRFHTPSDFVSALRKVTPRDVQRIAQSFIEQVHTLAIYPSDEAPRR